MPEVATSILRAPSIVGTKLTEVAFAIAELYVILRLQLPISVKLSTVIGTIAVDAVVVMFPSLVMGAFCAIRLVILIKSSIKKTVMNFMVRVIKVT
jgi:hypothetical protein